MAIRNYPTFKMVSIALFLVWAMALLSCGKSGSEGKAGTMDQLVPGEIQGWVMQDPPETYDRKTIFDYIDGAGEVFLAYDFATVMVFRYVKADNPEISAEIFDMGKSEDAYGVFTHARESEQTGVGQGYEYRGSVLSFWKDKYYISLMAVKETPESKEALFALGREVDRRIAKTGEKPPLITCLPPENLNASTIRYFHGQASLNYFYFLSEENILNLNRETRAVLGSYAQDGGYLLCIQYPNPQQAKAASEKFIGQYIPEAAGTGAAKTEQGKWTATRTDGPYVIVALDALSDDYARQLMGKCAEKLGGVAR